MDIITVVVTYNRKELLTECLNSLLSQTFEVKKIIIIDNASTDGTYELLNDSGYLQNSKIDYNQMETNLGGAGGFYEGIKLADKEQADWIWIMDDDSIPDSDCLKELTGQAYKMPNTSFFASCVYGPEGEPMNVPEVDMRPHQNGYPYWYEKLNEGIVKICTATFVSLLINNGAVKKCGLPCKKYFIWGDDSEYTKRLTKYFGDAYLVGTSRVCHKRINAKSLEISNESNPARIRNYFYMIRNNLVNSIIYDTKGRALKNFIKYIITAIKCLFSENHRFSKFNVIMHGLICALAEQKKFRDYIMSQISEEHIVE
ncbi:glycosyltransferase family 2 protein [Muricomes intestini]|jgi:GT2 family glycosyltransferase|uniref:glycosyltransferase family 2 protein n=1 Tax=Muricomes intestini TaxID=1796634 RepID=UPI000E8C58A2|nr:hypothetical protein [Lachnospiraceae bacterium]